MFSLAYKDVHNLRIADVVKDVMQRSTQRKTSKVRLRRRLGSNLDAWEYTCTATNPMAKRPCTGVPFAVSFDNFNLEKECINKKRIKTHRIFVFQLNICVCDYFFTRDNHFQNLGFLYEVFSFLSPNLKVLKSSYVTKVWSWGLRTNLDRM